jgi:hypothetical protein
MADESARRFLDEAWRALGGASEAAARVGFEGSGSLPSRFRVTDLAAAAIGTAALAATELVGEDAPLTIDRRLASLWFQQSMHPIGWELGLGWNPVGGDFETKDGWIRIHTNAEAHRGAALAVLGAAEDKVAVASAVRGWTAQELESAIVEAGGAAAEMRSVKEWAAHPQGSAVAEEPLVHLEWRQGSVSDWQSTADRPLAGVRVLDLTRVLAGPVATRFLAGLGADVLRIDPPGWDEEGVIPEIMLGKRSAFLDLRVAEGEHDFETLLWDADVLVHGYRPGALEHLGYGSDFLNDSSGLIEVHLDAYGWSGPWAGRRGFDSLVQMSCGIAEAGMAWVGANRPQPLPVQALDHATGYLMAAAALSGLAERGRSGRLLRARLSLARTAKWLVDHGFEEEAVAIAKAGEGDLGPWIEDSDWGRARRLEPPVRGIELHWDRPATRLGSSDPEWLS